MTAKKDILGLIDAGREIRRPPLVGMQFLHQRTMRTADFLRRSPQAARQGSHRPPVPSFCRCAANLRPPLPCHLARVHARRAPGGQDKQPIARGFPRRFPASRPTSVGTSSASSVTSVYLAGEDAPAHRAAVVIELHLDEGRAHARGLPRALLRAPSEGRTPSAAIRAAPNRRSRAARPIRPPPQMRGKRRRPSATIPPPRRSTTAS